MGEGGNGRDPVAPPRSRVADGPEKVESEWRRPMEGRRWQSSPGKETGHMLW
jgi:hypothetical protein